jgi:hypothetical protein
MRFIGLDVHRDFCEVAIAEAGRVRRARRVETTPAALELFAQSLSADDQVALEATGNAVAIARIIEPHVDPVGEDGQAGRPHPGEAARGGLSG